MFQAFRGHPRVPAVPRPAFLKLHFKLFVETVAHIFLDARTQGFIAGDVGRIHRQDSSNCHAILFPCHHSNGR
jgi:hypothetical protein